jgi:hypothetical protein
MYIISVDGREEEGAYAATDNLGRHILYIFEEEDDAIRFATLLEEDDYPKMTVIEVEEDVIIRSCKYHEYDYQIFTSNDIVIPPYKEDTNFI